MTMEFVIRGDNVDEVMRHLQELAARLGRLPEDARPRGVRPMEQVLADMPQEALLAEVRARLAIEGFSCNVVPMKRPAGRPPKVNPLQKLVAESGLAPEALPEWVQQEVELGVQLKPEDAAAWFRGLLTSAAPGFRDEAARVWQDFQRQFQLAEVSDLGETLKTFPARIAMLRERWLRAVLETVAKDQAPAPDAPAAAADNEDIF